MIWAANHWPLAVQVHHANHPSAEHVCQDLHQADWGKVPDHDVLLASPACQGHSTASRGNRSRKHDDDRATAWAVISAAEWHRPEVVIVENVEAFKDWIFFDLWLEALRRLGFATSVNLLDAADFGVPQHRERVFVVGVRAKNPVILKPGGIPHVGAASFVDLNAGRWKPVVRPGRSPKTLQRVARGRRNYGENFLVQAVTGHSGRCLDRPMATITTKDQWCVVRGDEMRALSVREYKAAMGFGPEYAFKATRKDSIKLCGNAVPPDLAAGVIDQVLEVVA